MSAHDKWVCEERRCRWCGPTDAMLSAPDPFNEGEVIYGCPKCRAIGTLVAACDEPGCEKTASCGTPTPAGYRTTCGDHAPR